jgi:hypothetical protein
MEPVIGHMKNDGRLGRNFLRGEEGDRLNAVLSAVGQNPRLLIRFIVAFFVNSWKIALFAALSRHFSAFPPPGRLDQPPAGPADRSTTIFFRDDELYWNIRSK